MQLKHALITLSVLAILATAPQSTFSAPPEGTPAAITPYLDNQTFLVVRLDIQELPLTELQNRIDGFLRERIKDPNFHEGLASAANQITGLRTAFLEAGGRNVYIVLSMSDVPYRPPFLVVTSSNPEKLTVLEGMISQLIADARPKMIVRTADGSLLIGPEVTLDRVQSLKAPPRPAFDAAWKAAEDAPLHVVLAPSSDHHRVLLETFPQFPRPWEQLNGQTISDGIRWAVLSINGTPKLRAQLTVESKDNAAAQRTSELVTSSLAKLAEFPDLQEIVPNASQIFALIQPKVQDKQVRIELTEDARTVEAIMKPLTVAVTKARATAQRAQSMNNLKQLALGMHIYHDKHKQFPPAASYDENGKPLLSWRVHLLPYMNQKALYDQFRLDEPWDSEHNKKLALTIPIQFLDPMQNLKPGATTYVVPVGKGTIFGTKEGSRLADIRDGSSNTLMIVSVPAEHAVPWTKPEDLSVDQNAPKNMLFNEHRNIVLAALADGSVHALADTIDAKTFWRMFQINDGQPADWRSFR